MLVLSRKPGEKIVIGDGITVTVVEVDGNRVRLGIEAPADVRILRGELAFWQEGPAEKPTRRLPDAGRFRGTDLLSAGS
jgi:carbon storage regulator